MKKIYFILSFFIWPMEAGEEFYLCLRAEAERWKEYKVFLWRGIISAIKFFLYAVWGVLLLSTAVHYFLLKNYNYEDYICSLILFGTYVALGTVYSW